MEINNHDVLIRLLNDGHITKEEFKSLYQSVQDMDITIEVDTNAATDEPYIINHEIKS
jgi:hypothetical protein